MSALAMRAQTVPLPPVAPPTAPTPPLPLPVGDPPTTVPGPPISDPPVEPPLHRAAAQFPRSNTLE